MPPDRGDGASGRTAGPARAGYQAIERELRITLQVVEVLAQTKHSFAITTQSSLVERDLDLLAPLAAEG